MYQNFVYINKVNYKRQTEYININRRKQIKIRFIYFFQHFIFYPIINCLYIFFDLLQTNLFNSSLVGFASTTSTRGSFSLPTVATLSSAVRTFIIITNVTSSFHKQHFSLSLTKKKPES